ncbi:MAG: TraC family protein [Candidatus Competibacteraceae bacterium]|nr:TraC family protein [Candidatus Competibacteraceae bacterium]
MSASMAAFFKRPPLLTRLFNRLVGDWPLLGGPIPLSQDTFSGLFDTYPSFADFLPLAGYDPETGLFELDDGVSVGAVFRLGAADLEGRSPEKREAFRAQVDHALQLLPTDDELYPVIVQFFLESREPVNIADRLAAATPSAFRDSPFSQAWFAAQREHFDMMCAPRGIFDDERVRLSGEHAKGWRAIEQQIHCCLFRKAPASAWKHRHYTAAQRFQNMISPFVSSLAAAGVRVQRLNEEGLRQWLLPWLTPDVAGFARPRAYLKAAGALPPRA